MTITIPPIDPCAELSKAVNDAKKIINEGTFKTLEGMETALGAVRKTAIDGAYTTEKMLIEAIDALNIPVHGINNITENFKIMFDVMIRCIAGDVWAFFQFAISLVLSQFDPAGKFVSFRRGIEIYGVFLIVSLTFPALLITYKLLDLTFYIINDYVN